MRFRNEVILLGGLMSAFVWLIPFSVPDALAANTYYVKEGEDGDGSESDPFGSIEDAVAEMKDKGGKKIIVSQGSYGAGFTLPKGVELVGSDTKEVIIKGAIRMEDKSELSEVTVDTGGILVAGKADVTIAKVRVRDVLLVGIKVEEGDGTVTIQNTEITGCKKGMYLQKGNEIRIENVVVSDNREEGIDIRENVSGSIRKSVFKNNGESGIEVVLGSSDLLIQDNTFSDNGASGVATQFFHGVKKIGDVRIDNNTMNNNTNYGVDCKTPQGGLESRDYFLNSIGVSGNTFSKNKVGEIAKKCRILTDEERIALDVKKSVQYDEVYSPEEFAERVQRDATARRVYNDGREKEERERVEIRVGEVEGLVTSLRSAQEKFVGRSPFGCFVLGKDSRLKKALLADVDKAGVLFERLARENNDLIFETNRHLVSESLTEYMETLTRLREALSLPLCHISLFGWLNEMIAAKLPPQTLLPLDAGASISLFPVSKERTILFLGNIGYTSKNRMQAFKNGDDSAFTEISDRLRSFDTVVADLTSPIIDEADPAPLQNSIAPLVLPARFANIFAVQNIGLFHLGQSPLFKVVKEKGETGYTKTRINMLLGTVETFGGDGAEPSKKIVLDGIPVTFVHFIESKTGAPEETISLIREAKEVSRTVIVYTAYDRGISAKLSQERQEVARQFIEAGATLVIGSGLMLPFEYETVGDGRIYHSLGNFWTGGEPTNEAIGLALRLSIDEGGQVTFGEENVFFNEEGKIIFAPKE